MNPPTITTFTVTIPDAMAKAKPTELAAAVGKVYDVCRKNNWRMSTGRNLAEGSFFIRVSGEKARLGLPEAMQETKAFNPTADEAPARELIPATSVRVLE